MEELILHIQYLLRRHSCVIVPRLGALIATERPAYVNEEWGIVQAPVREVCFNAAIVNNDGLLATSIARRERIPYEAACVRMERAIDELRQRLDTDGEVSLGRIGTLRRSADGRLIFDPALTARQQAAALGYQPVAIPSKESRTEEGSGATRTGSGYYILRVSKTATRIAAGIALPLVAAVSILLWTLSLGGGTVPAGIDYASVVPIPATKAEVQASVPAPQNVVEDQPQGVLVVAVFGTEQQVDLFLQQHAKSAHSLSVSPYGKSYRVTTLPQSRPGLLELLHDTDFIVEYPGAWIWMQDAE